MRAVVEVYLINPRLFKGLVSPQLIRTWSALVTMRARGPGKETSRRDERNIGGRGS